MKIRNGREIICNVKSDVVPRQEFKLALSLPPLVYALLVPSGSRGLIIVHYQYNVIRDAFGDGDPKAGYVERRPQHCGPLRVPRINIARLVHPSRRG